MSIQKYEIFLRTLEAGSVSRAARDLGLTQSAVSHALSSLEERFGFPLLQRSRSGVRLTEEGKRVLPSVRTILSAEIVERFRPFVANVRELLRLERTRFISGRPRKRKPPDLTALLPGFSL